MVDAPLSFIEVHAQLTGKGSPFEMEELLDVGVDGVMTDVPEVLLDVLANH